MTTQPTDTAAAEKIGPTIDIYSLGSGAIPVLLEANANLQAQLTAANERADKAEAAINDPAALHQNILRGTIKMDRATVLHIAGATDYDSLKEIADQATAEAAVLLEHIKGTWVMKNPRGFGRVIKCRFCNAAPVESPDAEVKHTADCPTNTAPLASAHLALHRRLVEGQRWREIESAPKDGTQIILHSDEKMFDDSTGIATARFIDGEWVCGRVNGFKVTLGKLTHWMPAPAPPIRAGVKP